MIRLVGTGSLYHFDSGAKLMGFRLRSDSSESFSAATWIEADGRSESFGTGQFFAEPKLISQVADREIPTEWHVKLPAKSVDIKIKALNPNAWMDVSIPYWEGPIRSLELIEDVVIWK